MFNKSTWMIIMAVYGGVVSFMLFWLSGITGYYIYTIVSLIVGIFFGIVLIGSLGSDKFEPFESGKWQGGIIIGFVMMATIVPSFWIEVASDIKDKINSNCAEKGLGEMCSTEDFCRVDCEELGKEYYKYEHSSGFFGPSISDCWCKANNKTEQIW